MAVAGCDTLATSPESDGEEDSQAPQEMEAAMLAKRVDAGELPPLSERLPAQPLVVEPLNAPGRYGGTLRGTTQHANATSDLQSAMVPALFSFSHDLRELRPELAASYEFNDDYTTCVIRLREGVKWSDGEPFTADDVVFYFEDWQFDEDLSPVTAAKWIHGGERIGVNKAGDFAVEFTFAAPLPAFALVQYSAPPERAFAPAHFLRQFHPKYEPTAVDQAEANGFESWQDRFLHFADSHYGAWAPERPDVAAWIPVEMSDERQRYERNPFYWKVDTDGRQLPYVDEVIIDYVPDLEVTQLRTQAGDVSVAGRDLALENYPVLKEGEERGSYRATLFTSERGADVAIAFNQEHGNPTLKRVFSDVRFRQAASVAIDRDQINKLVFLGQGVPRQATINEHAAFYRDEWGQSYAQFDPDLANQLLDEMGLASRNADGGRIDGDGAAIRFGLEFVPDFGPIAATVELVVQNWRQVGLGVTANPRDNSYMQNRVDGGKQDATAWVVDRQLERSAYTYGAESSKFRPGGDSVIQYASSWQVWFDSGGRDGIEPPDEAKELQAALEEWQQYDPEAPEYEDAAVRAHDLIAETLWVIGVVGEGPAPVIVKTNLENVLSDAVFSGDETVFFGAANWYWLPHRSEQWFFKSES